MLFKGKNFQPWGEFEISIDKLTVIVGPSNKGKSATFRALRGLLRNDLPEEYIRNNQPEPMELSVDVDGHCVEASRKKGGSTTYVIDHGKPYTSLNRKIPDEVAALKFGEVEIGDYSIDPIFAEQNKAQFLIDSDRYKPTELNAIIGAFSSTEKLDAGKKEANSRVASKNSEAKTLSIEIRDAEERKAKLLPLSQRADELAGTLHTLEASAREVEGKLGALLTVLSLRRKLIPIVRILKSCVLPELTEGQSLYQQIQYLNQAEKSLLYHTWLQRKESKLEGLESHFDGIAADWSELIIAFRKQKSVNGLLFILSNRKTSSEEYEKRLDCILSVLDRDTKKATDAQISIRYLSAAIVYRSRVAGKAKELSDNEVELGAAREELNKLTILDEEQKRQATLILCPKCGFQLSNHGRVVG
jgi:energy-coupling factor transporter ATP-binding protein EcfA2